MSVFIDKQKFVLTDDAGNVNGKALGYIYGVLDAFSQWANLDIRDAEGEAALYSLIARIFPAEVGRVGNYASCLRNMRDDPEIMNGVMLGGMDLTNWSRHKTPLTRWPTCFDEELARRAEQRDRNHK